MTGGELAWVVAVGVAAQLARHAPIIAIAQKRK
jgi:hypothetical protein